MTTFPDVVVTFDKLDPRGRCYCISLDIDSERTPAWTAPENAFRISGYELWTIDNDGLIGESEGRFDSPEYERQLKHGVDH
jgi:hypothetical protein